jgi:hypothetical protein
VSAIHLDIVNPIAIHLFRSALAANCYEPLWAAETVAIDLARSPMPRARQCFSVRDAYFCNHPDNPTFAETVLARCCTVLEGVSGFRGCGGFHATLAKLARSPPRCPKNPLQHWVYGSTSIDCGHQARAG